MLAHHLPQDLDLLVEGGDDSDLAVTIAANAACTGAGWRSCSARSDPPAIVWRVPRVAAGGPGTATDVRRGNRPPGSGSGALASSSRASGSSRSGKACSAADRTPATRGRRSTCRVRSHTRPWWARAASLMPSARVLSPATGRCPGRSRRTISASACASARVGLRPRDRVPLPVPRSRPRVDRVHRVPGRDQRGDPRAALGLIPTSTSQRRIGVAPRLRQVLSDQGVQPGHPGQPLREASLRPGPCPPRRRARRRGGPRPSHHPRTTPHVPPQLDPTSAQQRGGDTQRSNGQVLTAPRGTSSHQLSLSPHDQRAHGLPQDLKGQMVKVLTRQPLPEPSLPATPGHPARTHEIRTCERVDLAWVWLHYCLAAKSAVTRLPFR